MIVASCCCCCCCHCAAAAAGVPSLGNATQQLQGLSAVPAQVKAPRIKESAVQFECKLKHIYDTDNA